MTLLSLISDKRGFLATDQLVYSADELSSLTEAAELVERLRDSVARQAELEADAKQEGYSAGYKEGVLQAKAAYEKKQADMLLKLQTAYEQDVVDTRNACATLAIDIVRKIAGHVAPADWLYAEACTAAAELIDQSALVLRVHTDHYADMLERVNERDVFERVVVDESLAAGACFIDTRYGAIAIDLETQMQQVLKILNTDDAEP